MGDFAGGLLKYLRVNPVPRLTIGGGFGKMMKLAQGAMDLHSGRSQVDLNWLAARGPGALREAILSANSAQHVLEICGNGLAQAVAVEALRQVQSVLGNAGIQTDIIIVDRVGKIIAHAA